MRISFFRVTAALAVTVGATAFQNPLLLSTREDTTSVRSSNSDDAEKEFLSQKTFGGYTVKQRLREEVESPFRKVRFLFFAGSTASALLALYFSFLSTIKAYIGGFQDAMPLNEALTSDAINIGAAVVCGYLAYRDYQAGQANLERIARGGKLASLIVEGAAGGKRVPLSNFRRGYRVLIAAGGPEYIARLARSMTADQLSGTNVIPEKLLETDVMVVPILLQRSESGVIRAVETIDVWKGVNSIIEEDKHLDITRADKVISFPRGPRAWTEYLESEFETAIKQGFDVMEKGITITVKKNGKILRRATGLPPWGDLIGTMEVLDGSRFGMPGDSEKYGGP